MDGRGGRLLAAVCLLALVAALGVVVRQKRILPREEKRVELTAEGGGNIPPLTSSAWQQALVRVVGRQDTYSYLTSVSWSSRS